MQVRFKLDAYNPAEFYGALGLLELLSQQDDGITSHFESDGATGANSTFVLHSDKDIPLPDLRAIKVTAKGFSDPLIAPVLIEATSTS
ncbi:MAG: hypothetical protein DMG96_38360 [Acidobacteria bacterium]|nr:MAG: hypothetical protein DMG96_38360 [Acidobacteriota bacterium]